MDLKSLKLLVIEDSDDDAVLVCEELRRGGFKSDFHRVENADQLRGALAEPACDVIISDYTLPGFSAREALQMVQASGLDIPFIVVSGSVRETTIVEMMRAGARDYVMKENLTRLPLAVERELEEAEDRRQRRQLENQLRHAQRLESLGVLAGGVAHDFNNLLTGILGNVSLAMYDVPEGSRMRPWLTHAMQAAEHAASLTQQMLAYAGKGQFLLEPIDLTLAVKEIGELLAASVSKNVHLTFELRDGLPSAEADMGQLQQVLMNLVINAAEAIGTERAGTVVVSAHSHNLTESELRGAVLHDGISPGRYVCLEVRDTGCGMDGETLGRIFDPFFSTKFTGRGLGLSAVMGVVRSHHGTLLVKSEPGKGSAFRVFLPAIDAKPRQKPEPVQEQANGLHGTVLIIDDEPMVRRTAQAILEKRGMRVLLADSGRAGIDVFRRLSDRISLVLLDLTMPVMSGNDVLREIRAIRKDVCVLMSSGYSEEESMHRVSAGEVFGFVQKPYSAPQLLAKVRAAIASCRETIHSG